LNIIGRKSARVDSDQLRATDASEAVVSTGGDEAGSGEHDEAHQQNAHIGPAS
jgi:hypothetical protein